MSSVAEQLAHCLSDPDWLPFRLDFAGQRLLMVKLTPDKLSDAAFLDNRVLTSESEGFWVGLNDFAKVDPPQPTAQALFHVGHCGSTLLSRLTGEIDDVRAVREPLPLRELALLQAQGKHAQAKQWLRIIWGWLSRPEGQRVHIKLTSACACLLPWYLEHVGQAAALYVSLETYLTSASRGGGAGTDVMGFAEQRRMEWQYHCSGEPLPTEPAELAACGWLLNMHYFLAAQTQYPTQMRLIRFEGWLADIDQSMRDLATHYHWPMPSAAFSQHPLVTRYAKRTDVAYDAAARQADLALARKRFGSFVDDGMTWASKQRSLPQFEQLANHFSD